MATSFINSTTSSVGTTEVLIYTAPVGEKAILIGCNIANILNSTIPFDLYVKKGVNSFYVVKSHRVLTGENVEVMKGNKIVLDSEDKVYVKAEVDNSIDVILSILSGVT
jgi:hypothetical protein